MTKLRQIINPPYTVKDVLVITGSVLILLSLPVVAIILQKNYSLDIEVYETGGSSRLPSPSSISFAAGGDHGANSAAAASLGKLDRSGVAFYLALGDLDYDQTSSDAAWCTYVKNALPTLGPAFPFEIVTGNHEEQGGPDGYIINHAGCLPDRLNSAGFYPAQYYFDYPSSNPLVRVIMISPNLRVENTSYDYIVGSRPYSWLSGAIDGAGAAAIPWVAVGMHKNCLTTGTKSCDIGPDLLNLLVSKKVDLVLQGHEHNYQRSKQLSLSNYCLQVPINSVDASCVIDDGLGGTYTKGAGPVIVINGNFGRCCYPASSADSEAGYFAKINSSSTGFTKYVLTKDKIEATFVGSSGSFTDSFTILD